MIKLNISKRKKLGHKVLRLRARIEDWASLNGWKNMDNWVERKTANDEVIYKKTDWEYVDDMFGLIINNYEINQLNHRDTYERLNNMWKRYEVDVTLVKPNANLEPDWEQLQSMNWKDD